MDFEKELNRLNKNQRKSVEEIFGPVLVVAGPGTGKTQVLAMRIANIIHKTDTNPENILALTFTENAAAEMRERLVTLIGPSAHDVSIFTFHGFCNDIILTHPNKFIFSQKLEAADELIKYQILKDILADGHFKQLSPIFSPNMMLRDIVSAISSLKREGYDSEAFLKVAKDEKENFDNIPEEERLNKKSGKILGRIADQQNRVDKWLELAEVYGKFEKELKKRGLFDFDDMILLTIEQLKKDEDLLLELREKYLFFLVDEFQDTNTTQFGLLQQILEIENPNIFAVGDADQSIYRFQGASIENILLFYKHFPGAKIFSLDENYRSTDEIIKLSKSVIEKNEERLEAVLKQDNLVQQNIFLDSFAHEKKSGPLVQFRVFETEDNERFFVLDQIRSLQKSGVKLSDIAIIFRKNLEGEKWLDFLEKNSIPVIFNSRGSIFKDIKIRQFLDLLRLVKDPDNDNLFFRVLHFGFLEVEITDIWSMWEKANKPNVSIFKFLSENKEDCSDKINDFFQKLLVWQRDLVEINLPDIIRKIATESGFLNILLNSKNLEIETLNFVSAILNEAERIFHNSNEVGISELLDSLGMREEFGIPLASNNIVSAMDAVMLMTAHGAKGLEFENVFITNLAHGTWGDLRNYSKIKLPDNLLEISHEESKIEEERRLFYVALTRAKSNIFLSYYKQDAGNRDKVVSRFFDELSKDFVQIIDDEKKDLRSQVDAQFVYHKKDDIAKNRELLKQKISKQNFALSHTAFENFRMCMRKGLFENILYAPKEKAAPLALGSSVHKGLEVFFREMQKADKEPDIKVAIDAFCDQLSKERIDKKDKERVRVDGIEILNNFFKQNKGQFGKPVGVEMNFKSHGVFLNGNIPLTGKIDKVELVDENAKIVKVIDYKVSKPKPENEIRGVRDSDLANPEPGTGTLYRQLLFLSILTQESRQFSFNVRNFELQFLRPEKGDQLITRSFILQKDEIEELKQEISKVWNDIQKLDFPKLSPDKKKSICEKAGAGGKERCPFFEICWG